MKAENGQTGIQRKLVSGLFWVLLANLIVKPLWLLGVEVGVQNAVGNEMYGFYFAVFNLAYIFNILLDLGITNFNTRNIAQHPQLIGKHLSGILGIFSVTKEVEANFQHSLAQPPCNMFEF